MTEAARFYESEAAGLGTDFLDDIQRTINRLREHPKSGHTVSGAWAGQSLNSSSVVLIWWLYNSVLQDRVVKEKVL